MGAFPIALLLAGAIAAPSPVVVDLADATIRVRDAAPGTRGSVSTLPIARLPDGRRSITLTRAALASLVRRAAPGVSPAIAPAQVTFRQSIAGAFPACFVARTPIGVNQPVTADRVTRGACADTAPPVRHDGAAIVATRRIDAGEPVGRALSATAPAVTRGDALTLVSRSGPVTVERVVTALQPGQNGGRAFVRDTGGQVFAAPVMAQPR